MLEINVCTFGVPTTLLIPKSSVPYVGKLGKALLSRYFSRITIKACIKTSEKVLHSNALNSNMNVNLQSNVIIYAYPYAYQSII